MSGNCSSNTTLALLQWTGNVMLKSQKKQRNKKCPCGSEKKFKYCCLEKVKRIEAGIEAGKSRDQIMNEEFFESKDC